MAKGSLVRSSALPKPTEQMGSATDWIKQGPAVVSITPNLLLAAHPLLIMRNLFTLLVPFCLAGSAWAAPLSVVVLEDNYNTSVESVDFNFEINTARQAGLVAGTSYSEDPLSAGPGGGDILTQVGVAGGNAVILVEADLGAPSIWVSPDHNFVESPKFRINASLAPVITGVNPNDWLALTFGSANQGDFVLDPGNVSLLLTGSGAVQVFDNGGLVANTAVPDLTFHNVEIDVVAPSFGVDAVVNITVDNIPVLSNYTRTGGFTDNFVTVSGFDTAGDFEATTHLFDNLVISVPEPGCGLWGWALCAGGAFAHRRR